MDSGWIWARLDANPRVVNERHLQLHFHLVQLPFTASRHSWACSYALPPTSRNQNLVAAARYVAACCPSEFVPSMVVMWTSICG
jgi:hypothetical protein